MHYISLLRQSVCFLLLWYFFFIHRSPCLNELQKEYCVETKLISLDWQWVTLTCWCQMNRNGHSSPVMHKVEGKTHESLEKMKITSGKSTLFWYFLWSVFRSPMLTYVFLLIKMIIPLYFRHVWFCVPLVFALLLAILRLLFGFWSCAWKSKKQKTKVSYKI